MRKPKAAKPESDIEGDQLAKAMMLLRGIGDTQAKFIGSRQPSDAFADLLEILLQLTESEYGFIGEIFTRDDGTPYIKTQAITNICWSDEILEFYEKNAGSGLEFDNLQTLFGRVLTSGDPVISNDPATDVRRGGLPEGHPALEAFLGLPIYAGTDLVGIVGIANRPGGYDEALIGFLEPLLVTCSNLLLAHRVECSFRSAEAAQRASEERLRMAMQGAELGAWDYNPKTRQSICNERWYRMLGYEPNEFPVDLTSWSALIHPDDLPAVRRCWNEHLAGLTDVYKVEFRSRTKSGNWIWTLVTGQTIEWDRETKPTRVVGIQMDNTERKLAEEQFRLVVESAPSGMMIIDPEGLITLVNARIEQLFGYGRDELLGQPLEMLIPERYRGKHRHHRAHFFQNITDGVMGEGRDLCGLRKDGTEFSVEVGLNRIDTAAGTQVLASVVDITERKRLESQIKHQAFHDALTGLPNRLLFMDRLVTAQARAKRHRQGVAVIFIDLDNFKLINDSLGHHAGDRFLINITERLRHCLRPEDTVARLGGDEFTILIEELSCVEHAVQAAERIVESLRRPMSISYGEIVATCSIGIAYSENGESCPDSLLRDADTAMYHAKESGKGHCVLFDNRMNAQAVERMELEVGLRRALEREEFCLHYQPIVDLNTWQVCGAEALVRWNHPTRGLVPPDQFIPVAEETGLIVPIGEWVLREACRQTKEWHEQFTDLPPLTVSVNLSGRQLQRHDIVSQVSSILEETGFDPTYLKLEITESVLMNDVDDATNKFRKLRDLGIKLAVDDFGTGYSSMSSLGTFPVDTVKMDRSFIGRLGVEEEAEAIVAAIIMLSKSMKLDTTAEGLETEEQLFFVKALGCGTAQGYFFSRPLEGPAFKSWLREMIDCTDEAA